MNDIKIEAKTLSSNKFVAFFQKIGRAISIKWYAFSDKHPKLSKILFQVFMFWVFSMMVTIFQYLVMVFLPYAFGIKLAGKEFLWPGITISIPGCEPFKWSILGYDVQYAADGAVKIGGGLGYFIAFELATFFAQVINFPLQRNITYKSKGNVYYQAMWYFIAWLFISLFCNAITSFWIGWANQVLPAAAYSILTTFITGGVSMVIFFFVFKIIFPDLDKASALAKSRLENAKKYSANVEKIDELQKKYDKISKEALLSKLSKDYQVALKNADSKALAYEAAVKSDLENKEFLISKRYYEAVEAYKKKEELLAKLNEIKEE